MHLLLKYRLGQNDNKQEVNRLAISNMVWEKSQAISGSGNRSGTLRPPVNNAGKKLPVVDGIHHAMPGNGKSLEGHYFYQ